MISFLQSLITGLLIALILSALRASALEAAYITAAVAVVNTLILAARLRRARG